MKKILLFLLIFFGSATIVSAQTKINKLYYYFSGSTAQVTKPTSGKYTESSYSIPATVYYQGTTYKVNKISSRAFENCTNITTINMSEAANLTTIGDWAFSGCTKLTSISIPNTVTSIGEYNQEIKGKMNVEIIPVSA